jgi:O-antigen ligase
MLLPFLGVFFICGRWKTRIFLVCAAAIMVDVIVQCRSRGAFLAIIVGAGAALLFAPAGTRKKIYPLILLGALGAFALVDIGFWDRMSKINSIATEEEEDKSSTGRLLAWRAALSMASDHPLGIGFNNFKVRVGNYQPSIPGKDTHNTYLRCLSELGVQGLLFLALLIWNAMRQTYRLHKRREPEPDSSNYALIAWATGIALVIYLSAGMFISLTYVEDFYLLLMLPDALSKHRRSEMIEQGPELADISEARTDV